MPNLLTAIRSLTNSVLDVIYPEPIAWRSPSDWEALMKRLPHTEQMSIEGNVTEDVLRHKRLVRAAAFLWYQHGSEVQQLILRGKFGLSAEPLILERLSKEAVGEMLMTDFAESIDLIVPIPLHPKRYRERGFNQAELIARVLSRQLNIPMDTTLLSRVRDNKHQANLSAKERAHNAEHIFALRYPEQLYHKHILLVDDVITTGSTIRAAMDSLQRARDCKVSVFALAKSV